MKLIEIKEAGYNKIYVAAKEYLRKSRPDKKENELDEMELNFSFMFSHEGSMFWRNVGAGNFTEAIKLRPEFAEDIPSLETLTEQEEYIFEQPSEDVWEEFNADYVDMPTIELMRKYKLTKLK